MMRRGKRLWMTRYRWERSTPRCDQTPRWIAAVKLAMVWAEQSRLLWERSPRWVGWTWSIACPRALTCLKRSSPWGVGRRREVWSYDVTTVGLVHTHIQQIKQMDGFQEG
jgi:hypothetical protein